MPATGKASWLWLLAYFTILTLGELYLSPVGLSLVTKLAPARMLSLVMGGLAGDELHRQFPRRLARQLLEPMGRAEFFLTAAAIAALAGLVIAGLHPASLPRSPERSRASQRPAEALALYGAPEQ